MLLYESTSAVDVSTVLYFIICWVVGSVAGRLTNARSTKLLLCSTAFIAASGLKNVFVDQPSMDTNFYWYFGLPKTAPVGSIKSAFRELSAAMGVSATSTEDEKMQHALLTLMYEVLSNRRARDIYNRFNIYAGSGSQSVSAIPDPREDEFTLLLGVVGQAYLLWALVIYAATLPARFRAARTWLVGLLVCMLVIEVSLKATTATLPLWLVSLPVGPLGPYTTEAEAVQLMHLSFPCIIVVLQAVSEYFHEDADACTMRIVATMSEQQKLNEESFEILGDLLSLNSIMLSSASSRPSLCLCEGVEGSAENGVIAKDSSRLQDPQASGTIDAAVDSKQANEVESVDTVVLSPETLQEARENLAKVKSHLNTRQAEHAELNKKLLTLLEEHRRIVVQNVSDPLASYYWLLVIVLIGGMQLVSGNGDTS